MKLKLLAGLIKRHQTNVIANIIVIEHSVICNYKSTIVDDNIYRQVSNISRTLVDNYIVDHSDVVGASPVGAAPTTSSFST